VFTQRLFLIGGGRKYLTTLVKAVVLSGGPASVYDENAPQLPAEFSATLPSQC